MGGKPGFEHRAPHRGSVKILIAEDDAVSRRVLEATLGRWGHEVWVVSDGAEALGVASSPTAPHLMILDWMMPEMDGVEVCRRIRALGQIPQPYLMLLTAKSGKEDLLQGFDAGADDYLTKPFDRDELRARVNVGIRVLGLQSALADRVAELEAALARVKQLQGLLPICSYCKRIRDDKNYWDQVENYITLHSEARFSHGICPDCYRRIVAPELESFIDRPSQDTP